MQVIETFLIAAVLSMFDYVGRTVTKGDAKVGFALTELY